MILHIYYYYGRSCYGSTCCKLRKASFGLAIISLILSLVAIVDLLFDKCREEEQITVPTNAVVPVQSSHIEYVEQPGHVTYVQQQPTQDVVHHSNGAVTTYPVQYQPPIPVYQQGSVTPVVVNHTDYIPTTVYQQTSNSGTQMFTISHIALVALNILFCCLIIAFLSDCINC
ncbi:Oidioi.mRNA.OKI2018_I69.PAR.g11561.t1.cds [Oikopleura dioica]|uniref:Oidioi.mRNA.OKI2018_I69.PAR.g11561.t1.cds n=1 Tax=Oikopleura dioica TaxID=34765 RepID=A0ABN7RW74_OIKDI|nr:Oidioi.mRNA.OKI2018_I69.PAR.g11561.t1.cds [Oikopleura dioica]